MGGAFKAYEGRRVAYWVWCVDLRETEHLEDFGVDGNIILKGAWVRLIWFR
jgi:hypothetical protein